MRSCPDTDINPNVIRSIFDTLLLVIFLCKLDGLTAQTFNKKVLQAVHTLQIKAINGT